MPISPTRWDDVEFLATTLVTAWVLLWLAAVAIAAPSAALGPAASRRTLVFEAGPALVWSWLTMAIAVPLLSALHGFNWATALLVAGTWPMALWLLRHRGRYESTFRDAVRGMVYRAVSPQTLRAYRLRLGERKLVMLSMPILVPVLGATSLVREEMDLRLPMPADFDTLWHTRQLLAGTAVWDPFASLTSVLVALSSADALHVALALRFALVALCAAAAGVLVAEISRRRWAALVAAPAFVFAPHAAAHTWAVALVALVGSTSLYLWLRDDCPRDRWHALAALALGTALVMPFSGRLGLLFHVTTTPRYLEHRAAPSEAVRLARGQPDDSWIVAGAPELALEIGEAGRYLDLASFVSRFQKRAGASNFRFGLAARRLFVFIEKEPIDSVEAVRDVGFVDAQPAVYRVRRERARLQRLASRICDQYRRTHRGATIIHDDTQLRVYRIDL
jgi:hypothetical protein